MPDDNKQNLCTGGGAKGKRDALEPKAAKLYIEDLKSITEISQELGVSEVTLRKWRGWANWDERKKQKVDFLKSAPEMARHYVMTSLAHLNGLPVDERVKSDKIDAFIKLQKFLQNEKDPREAAQAAIAMAEALSDYVIAHHPDKAPTFAPILSAFLTEKRGAFQC